MSNPLDRLRGSRRAPARSSTPAPTSTSRAEQLLPAFIRRSSTPAPRPSRHTSLPLTTSHNGVGFGTVSAQGQGASRTEHESVAALQSAGLPVRSPPAVNLHSVSGNFPGHEVPEAVPEAEEDESSEEEPAQLWNSARIGLFGEGIHLPSSQLSYDWPAAQRGQESDYVLRVRWRNMNAETYRAEDAYVKLVLRNSTELKVIRHLLNPSFEQYSAMACPPVLNILELPALPRHSIILMPPLLPVDFNEMNTVGDCLDFVRQALEGLECLHSQGISHGDIIPQNIMIVPRSLGKSPMQFHISGSRKLHYCYIDFGFSIFLRPGERLYSRYEGPAIVAPEVTKFRLLNIGQGYDPLPADVWLLGELINNELLLRKAKLTFLNGWVQGLCAGKVEDRPTAAIARRTFHELLGHLTPEEFRRSTVRRRSRIGGQTSESAPRSGAENAALRSFLV